MSPQLTCMTLCFLAAALTISGCAESPVVDPVALDDQIENGWMQDKELVDAVEFLQSGGIYENEEPEQAIDQNHVLPLLKKIQDNLKITAIAVLMDEEEAMAIVIPNPESPSLRKEIVKLIQEADDNYPGVLTDHWGQKWISVDWFDEDEMEVFEMADSLDYIIQEHQRERQMILESN